MNTVVAVISAYVLIQFCLGAWVSRQIRTERDYILAGRSLGTGLVAFSVFATWFGAEAIQVSAGEIYDKGLSGALIDPFGYGSAVIIVGLVLAVPLWRRGITTFADMIRDRYSPKVEKTFILVLLPGSLFWAGAQIRAFGQILSSSSNLDVSTAILIAAMLVGAYSIVGGLLADAITDVVQGVVVIAGLVVLSWAIASQLGGVERALASITPDRLEFFSAAGDTPLSRVEKLAITLCGSIVSIELISRFLGASSANVARTGTLLGGAMYLVVGLMPIFLGLVGPNLLPGLKETEQIVPRLAEAFLPGVAYALFLGALVSAILSVVHAALHAPAAQISHNIVAGMLPDLKPSARLWSVRLAVLALSIVAFALAQSVERIRELVEIASAFGSAGAFVVAMFGVHSRFGGSLAAMASLISGISIWIVAKYGLDLPAPYLTALVCALGSYVLAGLYEKRSLQPA